MSKELSKKKWVWRGIKKRVSPGGEEREVKIGNSSKASRKEEEITDIATEGEGFASGALKQVPFETHKRHGITCASISN